MNRETNKSNFVLIVISIIGVLGTVTGAIINVQGNLNVERIRQEAELTRMAIVSIATQGGATQMVLQSTADAPTPLPYPTYTLQPEKVVVVTATSAPVTITPTAVPIQGSGFVFEDDFENGLDPMWNVRFGDLGMANGKLTITAPFSEQHSDHLAVLENLYWGNYKITFELADFNDTGAFEADNSHAAILLRYEENQDSVGFYFSGSSLGVQFGTFSSNNEWEFFSSSLVNGSEGGFNLENGPNTIVIECVGNTYTAFINNKKVTSFNIPGPEYGQVGVWLTNGTYHPDNTDQIAGRIEYITIESLPDGEN